MPVARNELVAAVLVLAAVAAALVWWALKTGAYFGTVYLPGAIGVFALLAVLLVAAPLRVRVRGPALVAVAALVALACWTLLSILWTSSPDSALLDGEQALLFAAIFALGIWACNLLGRGMALALAPVAAAGIVVAIVTTITLAAGSDVESYVHIDGTLRYPLGYRNADAEFFLICLWPVVALAAERRLAWQLRALLAGAGTMMGGLVLMCQSRGSLAAGVVAVLALLAFSPRRLRTAVYLGLVLLPVLPAVPVLLDPFQRGGDDPGLLPLLRDSARAIALTSLGSVALSALFMRGVEARLRISRQGVKRISWALGVAAAVVVVAGAAVFLARHGGPVGFVDQRIGEFERTGNPSFTGQGTRFGLNVGSNRGDFWQVSLDVAATKPVVGAGAGSFEGEYLRHRRSDETPKDPHSVEMLMLSELGVVGLLLFAAFLVATTIALVRSRRLGPGAATLAAAAAASGAGWLAHSSYDWLFHYPGVTAPAMFLLGAGVAPALLDRDSPRAPRLRALVAGAAVLAALLALPLWLSQRYTDRAAGSWTQDAGAAYDDLDRAADLDPFSTAPPLTEGVIAARLGSHERAVSAFGEAIDREPDNFAAHFLLAREQETVDPAAARAEVEEALRLNPHDSAARELQQRLAP